MPRNKEMEIRLCASKSLVRELRAIAQYNGITLATLLRPKLREFADSYPERVRQTPINRDF